MDKGDALRLKSVIAYCNDAERQFNRFGESFDAFTGDRDYYYALSMVLYQISELITTIRTPVVQERIKEELPWREIKAFRNVLAHGYGTVNDRLLWMTATEDLPKVKSLCESLLAEHG